MINLNLPLYPKHQPSTHRSHASQDSYTYGPIQLQIIMSCNVNRLDTMQDSFATTSVTPSQVLVSNPTNGIAYLAMGKEIPCQSQPHGGGRMKESNEWFCRPLEKVRKHPANTSAPFLYREAKGWKSPVWLFNSVTPDYQLESLLLLPGKQFWPSQSPSLQGSED